MRRILFILFLLPLFTISQIEKIKISKEKSCGFEIKIDESIDGKRLRVRKITHIGLTTQESSAAFHAYRNVDLGDRIDVNKTDIENRFYRVCKADDKVLKEIKVIEVNDGLACALEFTYEDANKEAQNSPK